MNTIIYLVIAAAFIFSLFKLFPLAGRKSWEALIPGYNLYIWIKVIEKPWWWVILLIFPGVNIIMLMIMSGMTAICFNKRSTLDLALAFFLPFIYLPKIALEENVAYVGPIDRKIYPKTTAQDWRDAILFAIVAASLIRTYVFEAYTIPTSSMENSLLVGDYLFVDKISYGPKIPETPLSIPFAHHTLPLTETVPSYLEWIKLPYFRLPGFTDIDRNDVVVFHFPAGDTVLYFNTAQSFDAIARQEAFTNFKLPLLVENKPIPSNDLLVKQTKNFLLDNTEWTVRPNDKKDNYIKRCVAIPGDEIIIRDADLFINGERAEEPEQSQYTYIFKTNDRLNPKKLNEDVGVSKADIKQGTINPTMYNLPLTDERLEEMKSYSTVVSYEKNLSAQDTFAPFFSNQMANWSQQYLKQRLGPAKASRLAPKAVDNIMNGLAERKEYHPTFPNYPNDSAFTWTEDNFGPLWVPKAGETIELTQQNLILYAKVIRDYERKDLVIRDGQAFINGEAVDTYTFEMNYYFMMGDNRHKSADSRFWGFVPENHVVGKAAFVWLSLNPDFGLFDGKIRWERIFHLID